MDFFDFAPIGGGSLISFDGGMRTEFGFDPLGTLTMKVNGITVGRAGKDAAGNSTWETAMGQTQFTHKAGPGNSSSVFSHGGYVGSFSPTLGGGQTFRSTSGMHSTLQPTATGFRIR